MDDDTGATGRYDSFMRTALPVVLTLSLACGGLGSYPAETDALTSETPAPPAGSPAPERGVFPLEVGDRWTWQVVRSTGAGLRLLFLATIPATADPIAEWTLTIDSQDPPESSGSEERYHATLVRRANQGLPARTDLVLWHQDGELWMQGVDGPQRALEQTIPPAPVGAERVPCTVHFLDGVSGLCSPAPRGIGDVAPGPTFAVLSQDPDAGRGLVQVLVGISTAGLIIPGNQASSETLQLVAWEPHSPGPTAERVDQWRKRPTLDRLDRLLPGSSVDEAAALLVEAYGELPNHRELLEKTLDALPLTERAPIVRVALGLEPTPEARWFLLAAAAARLGGLPDGHAASIAAKFPEPEREAALALAEHRWRGLEAVLLAVDPTDPKADPAASDALRLAALHEAIPSHPPDAAESVAILLRFEKAERAHALLMGRADAGERAPMLIAACKARTFDDERLALLDGQDAVLASLDADGVEKLLDTWAFDEGLVAATGHLIAAQPAERRPTLLVQGMKAMSFDEGRFKLMDAHPDLVAAMSEVQRTTALATFVFEREDAKARLGKRR